MTGVQSQEVNREKELCAEEKPRLQRKDERKDGVWLWRNINSVQSSPSSVTTVPPWVHVMAFEGSYFCGCHMQSLSVGLVRAMELENSQGHILGPGRKDIVCAMISSLKRCIVSAGKSSHRGKAHLHF